jgi:AcrB/AcrD/AcrF family
MSRWLRRLRSGTAHREHFAAFYPSPDCNIAADGGDWLRRTGRDTVLPVARLPQVDFPTIQVNVTLRGASAETMAASVASPLERQFGQIPSITQLTSVSALNTTSITSHAQRARHAIHDGRLCPDGGARSAPWSRPRAESSRAHAPPCLWLCVRQQGARHAGDSGMVGTPVDHVESGVHSLVKHF